MKNCSFSNLITFILQIIELEASREMLNEQFTSQSRTITELEQIKKVTFQISRSLT